jgi:hypothetical protein
LAETRIKNNFFLKKLIKFLFEIISEKIHFQL